MESLRKGVPATILGHRGWFWSNLCQQLHSFDDAERKNSRLVCKNVCKILTSCVKRAVPALWHSIMVRKLRSFNIFYFNLMRPLLDVSQIELFAVIILLYF